MSADRPDHSARFPRAVLALSLVSALVLLVGVLTAAYASRGSASTYPKGSPQAALAAYLHDLQAGDLDSAYARTRFDDTNGQYMDSTEFHLVYAHWRDASHRATLQSVRRDGNSAHLGVTVVSFAPDNPLRMTTGFRQTFTLRRTGSHWYIAAPAYLQP